MGWGELHNGDLIAVAEVHAFDVMVTADKKMQYHQNLARRRLSVIVLNSRRIIWQDIVPLAPQLQSSLDLGIPQGAFIRIEPAGP